LQGSGHYKVNAKVKKGKNIPIELEFAMSEVEYEAFELK